MMCPAVVCDGANSSVTPRSAEEHPLELSRPNACGLNSFAGQAIALGDVPSSAACVRGPSICSSAEDTSSTGMAVRTFR
eukprot:scaffold253612_cov30-Tisochrysis_lutea.AAC.3